MKNLTKKVITVTLLNFLSMGAFGSTMTVVSNAASITGNGQIVIKLVNSGSTPSFCSFRQASPFSLQAGGSFAVDFTNIASYSQQSSTCTQSQINAMWSGSHVAVGVEGDSATWGCLVSIPSSTQTVTITSYNPGGSSGGQMTCTTS